MVDPKVIKELKKERDELAKKIADLIDEFQQRNGVGVKVQISQFWSDERGLLNRPQVTIKLEL